MLALWQGRGTKAGLRGRTRQLEDLSSSHVQSLTHHLTLQPTILLLTSPLTPHPSLTVTIIFTANLPPLNPSSTPAPTLS